MPLRSVLALTLALVFSMPAAAEKASPAAADISGKLSEDALLHLGSTRLTGARDWTVRRTADMLVLDAPEQDTHVAVVEVAAPDAKAAVKRAFARYQPASTRKVRLVLERSAGNGWDEAKGVDFDTSPDERKVVEAVAMRKGKLWTVFLVDGAEQTVEKRSAALTLMDGSVRPLHYVAESFAGRKAHPLDAARQARLRQFLQASMKTLGIPGLAYALIDQGKVVYEGGIGVRELGKPELVDANTLFMAASNTKGMSTLLLATLVDQGKLKWDQPVIDVYPKFKLGNAETTSKVLVKHLVCACTGLPRQDLEMLFEFQNHDADSAFKLLAGHAPTSRFGEVFQYNNLMAAAAGYIGGHIAYPGMPLGEAFDAAMQNAIFTPLGMASTTFDMAAAQKGNHASGHGIDRLGKMRVLPMDLNYSLVPHRPAGGVWTSAHDMARYVLLEANLGKLPDGRQLLSSVALLARRLPHVADGDDSMYGMGLAVAQVAGVPVVSHGGSLFGYKSNFYLLPEAGVGLVLLTNSDRGMALTDRALRRLLEIVYDGKPEAAADLAVAQRRFKAFRDKDRSTMTVPPRAALVDKLAAHYVSAELGELRVQHKGTATVFDFGEWRTEIASRKNADGTYSLLALTPEFLGLPFSVGSKDGKRTVILRDGQHEYVFAEQ